MASDTMVRILFISSVFRWNRAVARPGHRHRIGTAEKNQSLPSFGACGPRCAS